jgi:hypothetical protein
VSEAASELKPDDGAIDNDDEDDDDDEDSNTRVAPRDASSSS